MASRTIKQNIVTKRIIVTRTSVLGGIPARLFPFFGRPGTLETLYKYIRFANVKECGPVRGWKCRPWATKTDAKTGQIDSIKVLTSLNNQSLFTQKCSNWHVHQADPAHLCWVYRGRNEALVQAF